MVRNPMAPLYNVKSPIDAAFGGYRGAAQTYSSMTRNQTQRTEGPSKTVGGGISAAAGMGMAGYILAGASKGAIGGGWGAAIGAGVGLFAYLLS